MDLVFWLFGVWGKDFRLRGQGVECWVARVGVQGS